MVDMGFDNASRNLASLGIVDFDSNAFIRGTKPAYVGSPEPKVELPFDAPLPIYSSNVYPNYLYSNGPTLSSQPSKDAFVSHRQNEGISLKEGLFGGILGALGLLGVYKLISRKKKPEAPKATPEIKTETKAEAKAKAATSKAAAKAEKAAEDVAKTAEKPTVWARVKGAGSTAFTKVKSAGSTVLDKAKGAPPWIKVAVGITAGVTTLYGLYKAFSHPQPPHQQEYPQIH